MRDVYERLRDIQESIERIMKYTSQGRDSFDQNELVQTWVVHHLEIIGEVARSLFMKKEKASMRSRAYPSLGLVSICLMLLVGCTTREATPTIPLASETTLSCKPLSKPVSLTWHDGGYWVRGTVTNNAQLQAILMPTTNLPLQTGKDVKIIWQMSGSGNFTIVAQGPDGASVLPTQGPGPVWVSKPSASSLNGWGEWGTVFRLSMAGCWTFHATRDNASGDLSLLVVAA